MRLLAVLCLLAPLAAPASAQDGAPPPPVVARTSDGRLILVNPNGTWAELGEVSPGPPPAPPAPPPPAPPRATVITEEPSGTRSLVSASGTYEVVYDPALWSRPRATSNDDAEFELTLPFGAGYAISIYEAFPATSEQVRDLVIANAEEGIGGRVDVLRERPVLVDGVKGIQIEFVAASSTGLDFLFLVTAVGGDFGALQLTTFTSVTNRERHFDTLVEFHKGLRLTPGG